MKTIDKQTALQILEKIKSRGPDVYYDKTEWVYFSEKNLTTQTKTHIIRSWMATSKSRAYSHGFIECTIRFTVTTVCDNISTDVFEYEVDVIKPEFYKFWKKNKLNNEIFDFVSQFNETKKDKIINDLVNGN
jgi:hypothetical protein